jgi:hypothetical protein
MWHMDKNLGFMFDAFMVIFQYFGGIHWNSPIQILLAKVARFHKISRSFFLANKMNCLTYAYSL